MDPSLWIEPDYFKPERFLDEHGQVDMVKKEKIVSFSLGAYKHSIEIEGGYNTHA
jgi:cytochrome P450